MLKPWKELREVDVTPYTKTRKAKDDNGKTVDIPYLPWTKCIDLLYEHGAEKVDFRPVMENRSYLICSREVETLPKTKTYNGQTETIPAKKCGCYFVRVEVEIDDLKWTYDYPLLNGANVVYDDNLNQRAINTAHARAFVKAVAIKTGLGWSLWAGDEEEDKTEDMSFHNIRAIQKRMQEKLTALLQHTDIDTFCKNNNISQKNLNAIMTQYFDGIAWLESKL